VRKQVPKEPHMASAFFLGEPFEITGQWWLPTNPGTAVAGVLRYSPRDARLELFGTFDEGKDALQAGFSEKIATIHGISAGGFKVSLLKNFVASRSSLVGASFHTTTYSPIYVLAGDHATEQTAFGSMEFYPEALNEFVMRRSFNSDWSETEDGRFMYIEHARPVEYPFQVNACGATITLKTRSRLRPGDFHSSISVDEFFDIQPKEPQSLDWYVRQMWRLCYLLRLLTNVPVMPRQAILGRADSDGHAAMVYRFEPIEKEYHDAVDMLFRMGDVVDDFGQILEKWFGASDSLVTVIHLFMHAQAATSDNVGRFLTLTQALVTFSRHTGHAEYLSKAAWEPIANRIINEIPQDIDPDHRRSLTNRIGYGNEFSLRKRIKLLVDSLSANAQAVVCSSTETFVSGLTETRNYLTHYTDELKAKALQGADLHWACERALMLLRFLLLREIGIADDLAYQRVSENPSLAFQVRQYRQFRECV
jgi:hypothetical protein